MAEEQDSEDLRSVDRSADDGDYGVMGFDYAPAVIATGAGRSPAIDRIQSCLGGSLRLVVGRQ